MRTTLGDSLCQIFVEAREPERGICLARMFATLRGTWARSGSSQRSKPSTTSEPGGIGFALWRIRSIQEPCRPDHAVVDRAGIQARQAEFVS
jgi:hypothetical protein